MLTAPDIVIRNGTVFDGTGDKGCKADVIVDSGKIQGVVSEYSGDAAVEIDASGLYVTPGFIDIHSHADYTLMVDPRAVSSIYQGVTLEVVGNCGFGCFPIYEPSLGSTAIYGYDASISPDWASAAEYLHALEEREPAVNVITLIPNGQVRMAAAGLLDREADADELRTIIRLVEQSMEEGAWGFSTGLEYAAEGSASEAEVTEVCRHISRLGALYATHTRFRDKGAVEAVAEAVRTGERTGVRLQISHLLPRSNGQQFEQCVSLVDEAFDRGTDIAFDMHTRLYGTTYLYTVLPPWALSGGPSEIAARLNSNAERERMKTHQSILSASGDWERVVLLDNPLWPDYARRSIADIALERGQEPLDAVYDILARDPGRLYTMMTIINCYTPSDQEGIFKHQLCMPASDATTLATDGPLKGSTLHGAYTWAAWYWRFMVQERGRNKPR